MPSRDNDSSAARLACSPPRLGAPGSHRLPVRDLSRSLRGGEPSFFSAALVAAPWLLVVLDLELCSPVMPKTDEEEALMRRKGRVIFG